MSFMALYRCLWYNGVIILFLEDIIMKLLLVEDDIEISQMLENVSEGF